MLMKLLWVVFMVFLTAVRLKSCSNQTSVKLQQSSCTERKTKICEKNTKRPAREKWKVKFSNKIEVKSVDKRWVSPWIFKICSFVHDTCVSLSVFTNALIPHNCKRNWSGDNLYLCVFFFLRRLPYRLFFQPISLSTSKFHTMMSAPFYLSLPYGILHQKALCYSRCITQNEH